MKKYGLLLLMLVASVCTYASVVMGNIIDGSGAVVANQLVHVMDSSSGGSSFSVQGTTDASGNYSITLPGTITNGDFLLIYTEKCGITVTHTAAYAGTDITADFSVCPNTPPAGNAVSGTVTKISASGNPAYPTTVYLIHETYDSAATSYTLTLIDSTSTDSSGYYAFNGVMLPAAELLVKAALTTANNDYAAYLPTYKENSISWSTAHIVSFTAGANDIHMVHGVNPGGPGFIGGSVSQGANKNTGVGDPLAGRILLLTTDADVAVGYTYTNTAGQFSFPNLAYGTYKLFGDALGKTNVVQIITIDANTPMADDVTFYENSHLFTTGIGSSAVLSSVTLFPNPVTSQLTLTGLDAIQGKKTASIITFTGAVLMTQSTNGNQLLFACGQLPSGLYLVQVCTGAGTATYRIIK